MFEEKHSGSYDWHMAVGLNQWYHFGVGAKPILVYFSGAWDAPYIVLLNIAL